MTSLDPSSPARPLSIAIAGAGSVGGYVGALLALGGHDVRMLARRPMLARIDEGLMVSSHEWLKARVPLGAITGSSDPSLFRGAELILLTVKAGATREMAELIAAHAGPEAVIISLQNGIGNVEQIRDILPDHDVRAGMVPFNVLQTEEGTIHRGTSGEIMIEEGKGDIANILSVPHMKVRESSDMTSVLWGKLLINLNNALNALSGLTLYEEFSDRGWRSLLARQMEEALSVITPAGIKPAQATSLPPLVTSFILRLPTPLFRTVAGRTLKIDRLARSSMWEDLERGRPTEINVLQGAVEALAEKQGRHVPTITRVADLIRQAEARGQGSPQLTPRQVSNG